MRSLLTLWAASVLVASTAIGCAAPADEEVDAETEDALRSFTPADGEHPEVGILYFKEGRMYCSATAVGRRTILTAAHCATPVDGAPAGTTCKGTFQVDTSGQGGSRAAWAKVPFHTCARKRVPGEIPGERDLAVIHLDADLPASIVPATVATDYPDEGSRTIFGYGRFGSGCSSAGDMHKRKATIRLSRGLFRTTTCPGDSGAPHFLTGTNRILGVVSGDMLLQVTADPVAHSAWVNGRVAESEAGRAFTEDAVTSR